jgi:hypothetical protein
MIVVYGENCGAERGVLKSLATNQKRTSAAKAAPQQRADGTRERVPLSKTDFSAACKRVPLSRGFFRVCERVLLSRVFPAACGRVCP